MTGNYNSNTKPEMVEMKQKLDSMRDSFEDQFVQKSELISMDRRFSNQDEINQEYDDSIGQMKRSIEAVEENQNAQQK